MRTKILTIAFATILPVTIAMAQGNTTDVEQYIITNVINVDGTLQSNALSQPSRRDVAGAVILDLEHTDTVGTDSVKLEKE